MNLTESNLKVIQYWVMSCADLGLYTEDQKEIKPPGIKCEKCPLFDECSEIKLKLFKAEEPTEFKFEEKRFI